MSYRVEYTPQTWDVATEESSSAMIILMTLTVFALFLFVLHNYFPAYWTGIQNHIWPGDATVTRGALEKMVGELKDGLPFSRAAATFCTEIFQNAGIR